MKMENISVTITTIPVSPSELKVLIAEAVQLGLEKERLKATETELPKPEFLTAKQVMFLFNVASQTTLYARVREGVIPEPIFMGRKRFWRYDEIMAVINKSNLAAPQVTLSQSNFTDGGGC